MTDRNGSLGRQAERVARSATDRRNLIWVMPAQGANTRFAGLGTLAYYAGVPFFVRRDRLSSDACVATPSSAGAPHMGEVHGDSHLEG